MRRLPKKHEILRRAEAKAMQRQVVGMGVEPTTPTEKELKESGVFHEARLELMRAPESEAMRQQHKYLSEMASEMGLVMLRKREHREQLRKVEAFDVFKRKHPRGIMKVNGYKIVFPSIPKPKRKPTKPKLPRVSLRKPLDIGSMIRGAPKPKKHRKPSHILDILPKPKPKKRRKRHVSRTGKTMRKLRKRVKNGQKVFSFPDHVWKVRKP